MPAIINMLAILQVTVPKEDFIFNSRCPFNCADQGYDCDFALLRISADRVPQSARQAALQVYKWSAETAQEMEIYGYGNTGRADEFPTVNFPLVMLHVISNLDLVRLLVSHAYCVCVRDKVQSCEDMIYSDYYDDDDDSSSPSFFRHARNVITSATEQLLMYQMDCTSPSPQPVEGLASAGDSGGCVLDAVTMMMSMTSR